MDMIIACVLLNSITHHSEICKVSIYALYYCQSKLRLLLMVGFVFYQTSLVVMILLLLVLVFFGFENTYIYEWIVKVVVVLII